MYAFLVSIEVRRAEGGNEYEMGRCTTVYAREQRK